MLLATWVYAGISVVTRFLKDIHFSVIIFHYTIFASILIFIYLTFEYLLNKPDFPDGPRILTYNKF